MVPLFLEQQNQLWGVCNSSVHVRMFKNELWMRSEYRGLVAGIFDLICYKGRGERRSIKSGLQASSGDKKLLP